MEPKDHGVASRSLSVLVVVHSRLRLKSHAPGRTGRAGPGLGRGQAGSRSGGSEPRAGPGLRPGTKLGLGRGRERGLAAKNRPQVDLFYSICPKCWIKYNSVLPIWCSGREELFRAYYFGICQPCAFHVTHARSVSQHSYIPICQINHVSSKSGECRIHMDFIWESTIFCHTFAYVIHVDNASNYVR